MKQKKTIKTILFTTLLITLFLITACGYHNHSDVSNNDLGLDYSNIANKEKDSEHFTDEELADLFLKSFLKNYKIPNQYKINYKSDSSLSATQTLVNFNLTIEDHEIIACEGFYSFSPNHEKIDCSKNLDYIQSNYNHINLTYPNKQLNSALDCQVRFNFIETENQICHYNIECLGNSECKDYYEHENLIFCYNKDGLTNFYSNRGSINMISTNNFNIPKEVKSKIDLKEISYDLDNN